MALTAAPCHHLCQFFIIEPFDGDSVDLDLQPGRLGGFQPVKHLAEVTPAGNLTEFVGIEGINGNVDPPHPGAIEIIGHLGQLAAIGGDGDFLKVAAPDFITQVANEVHDVPPDQRLPAGQPDLARADFHEAAADDFQFFQRQQISLGQKGHFLCHAVNAAKIASVGDGYPQVGDRATEWVQNRICLLHDQKCR